MVARAHLRAESTIRNSGWMQVILRAGSMLLCQVPPREKDGGLTLLISAAPLLNWQGLVREERRYTGLDRDKLKALAENVVSNAKRKWGEDFEVSWSVEELVMGRPLVVPLSDEVQRNDLFWKYLAEFPSDKNSRLPRPHSNRTSLVFVSHRLKAHDRNLLADLLDCWLSGKFGQLNFFAGCDELDRGTNIRKGFDGLEKSLKIPPRRSEKSPPVPQQVGKQLLWMRRLHVLLEYYRRRLEKREARSPAQRPWRSAVAAAIRRYRSAYKESDSTTAVNSTTKDSKQLTPIREERSSTGPRPKGAMKAAHQGRPRVYAESASIKAEVATLGEVIHNLVATVEELIHTLEQREAMGARFEGKKGAAHQDLMEAQSEGAMEAAHQNELQGDAESEPMSASRGGSETRRDYDLPEFQKAMMELSRQCVRAQVESRCSHSPLVKRELLGLDAMDIS